MDGLTPKHRERGESLSSNFFDLRFDPTHYKSQLLLQMRLAYACPVPDYLTTTEDELLSGI